VVKIENVGYGGEPMMPRITRTATIAGVAAAAFLHAAALRAQQTLNVKLGLWEATSTSQSNGAPPIDTSKMTPEQRARVEAMMAARGGGRGAPSAPRVQKTCMTKEKLEKESFQVSGAGQAPSPSCNRTITSSTSTLQEVHIECSGPPKRTSDFRIEALAPDKVKVTAKIVAGDAPNAMTINANTDARWLSASCGDVK
jgi:hypothetical protein